MPEEHELCSERGTIKIRSEVQMIRSKGALVGSHVGTQRCVSSLVRPQSSGVSFA